MLLGVDVGGTFTDAVLLDDDGALHTAKVPSTPAAEQEGVARAIAAVLERSGAEAKSIERFAHGMTVATNALLEGRTARTALIATAGFTDVIELGRQARPNLYRLCEAAPAPLVTTELRLGAPERMGPGGPIEPLPAGAAAALAERLAEAEPQAVAVSLLHSYADPSHEREIGAAVSRALPRASLSLSSELVGTFREYERTATTVLDAALSPALGGYLSRLSELCAARSLPEPLVMQSSGGLTETARAGAHAALTVLSGPAGGVGGATMAAAVAGEPDVACFDMGGTSCDVCLIEDGVVPETAERVIAGRPVALPALDIHTVGAGGGSIAWRDAGGALRVGPASAGARPGPACYGRGGELPTVTDANLLLGRLLADVPLADGVSLDRAAAERAVGRLAAELRLDTLACAEGIVRVAEAEMLGALRLVTMEQGVDPRPFALMPFGGAGPLHAAAMAEQLGMSRVLCPRACGVLSALGLAAAPPRRDTARTVLMRLDERAGEALQAARSELVREAASALGEPAVRVRVRYELRYLGQSFELPVEEERGPGEAPSLGPEQLLEAFAAAHLARYGYREDGAVELVNVRACAWGVAPLLPAGPAAGLAPARETRPIVFAGAPVASTVLIGEPQPGEAIAGPALCAMPQATLLVPPGWAGAVDEAGTIRLGRAG